MRSILPALYRHDRKRRGAAMAEFALVFTVFLLVITGLIELGRAVWAYTTIAHAARQGVRYAMSRGRTNPTTADQVRDVVRNAAVGLNPNAIDVTTTWNGGNSRGNVVQVSVRYSFNSVAGRFLLSSPTIPLGANTRAVVAN